MHTFLSLFRKEQLPIDQLARIRNRAPITGIFGENNFGFKQRIYHDHVFMEIGSGQPIIFCHGLFGSFRNFAQIGKALSNRYRVIVPCMPMYDAPLSECSVENLGRYLGEFIEDLGLKDCILVGNSMGGGAILTHAIAKPSSVSKIVLLASSGLSFIPMKGGFMKIKDFQYVKELMSGIFYDASWIKDEEVREIYNVMQNKQTLLRCLSFTRSTKRNFLHESLKNLDIPTLVIWGKEDTVTPPFIAEEFRSALKNCEVHYLDHCGHVPSYEKPEECLQLLESFLAQEDHSGLPTLRPLLQNRPAQKPMRAAWNFAISSLIWG